MDGWRTISEPFRIHAVEPIRLTTRAERSCVIVEGRQPATARLASLA